MGEVGGKVVVVGERGEGGLPGALMSTIDQMLSVLITLKAIFSH